MPAPMPTHNKTLTFSSLTEYEKSAVAFLAHNSRKAEAVAVIGAPPDKDVFWHRVWDAAAKNRYVPGLSTLAEVWEDLASELAMESGPALDVNGTIVGEVKP